MFQSSDRHIEAKAAKYLKIPEPAGGKPLPPLAELAQRRGNAEHGK